MKAYSMTLAVLMISASVAVHAADREQDGTLPGITVRQDSDLLRNECRPPAYADVCDFLHAQIRRNFSRREIVLLFGARSSLPEYRTSETSTRARYEEFLREVDMYGTARSTASLD